MALARVEQERAGRKGKAATVVSPLAGRADPADRAAYLEFIRALARQAARADHAAERDAPTA